MSLMGSASYVDGELRSLTPKASVDAFCQVEDGRS